MKLSYITESQRKGNDPDEHLAPAPDSELPVEAGSRKQALFDQHLDSESDSELPSPMSVLQQVVIAKRGVVEAGPRKRQLSVKCFIQH